MNYPYLTKGAIEQAAARALREAFGDDIPYPLDLDYLVYEHFCDRDNLIFDNERNLGFEDGEEVLGKTLPLSRQILITSSLGAAPAGRYRFTVAHEIGHWVLHRSLFTANASQADLFGPANTPSELVSLNRNVFHGHLVEVPTEEWQANYFAAALLVNERVLQQAFQERFGDKPLAVWEDGRVRADSLRALARTAANERIEGLPSLCDMFGLSKEAMAIALERRGYVLEDAPVL